MTFHTAFAFALASGLSFTLLGIAYRMAQLRQLPAKRIVLILCLCGAAFFALRTDWATLGGVPARVIVMATIAGLSQWGATAIVALALRTGPFAPVWCTTSLYFVPVLLYAHVALGDHVRPMQYVSLAAAIAAVLCSAGATKDEAADARHPPIRPVAYGALLLLLLFVNGLSNIILKELGSTNVVDGRSLIDLHQAPFLMSFYIALAAGVAFDMLLSGDLWKLDRVSVGLGLLGGVGSVFGIWAQAQFARYAVLFSISSAVTILGASLISVAFFRERVTRRWAATIVLTLLAVGCAYEPPAPAANPSQQATSPDRPADVL